MECKVDEFLIQEYLDGGLDQLERIVMEEHIKVCRKCRRELTEMKLLIFELHGIPSVEIPKEASRIGKEFVKQMYYSNKNNKIHLRDILNTQRSAFRGISSFLGFIPGIGLAKEGMNRVPALLYRAAGAAFQNGKRLIAARVRA